ncbi:ankyrin repeat, PH and SEC7 domain containing protein secG-like isoform X2 [Symsagittifera roscoffensis]|uniref:ankyrin repeat, PH and SEC7 domain containing protein secG-like isoform X2 n=1 Tax=Symsagittifera roscoffensis TaxID=84072 RepID=UPI00307CB1C9
MLNYQKSMLFACNSGNLDVILDCIKAGANVDTKNDLGGRTALHEACIGGHAHVVKYLTSVVSSCDVTDGQGQTAAHLAAFHGESQCLEELARARALLHQTDNQGKTPAHLAASRNHLSALQTLNNFNCDLDNADESGKTPAHYAAQAGAFECLNFLIKQDVNIRESDLLGQQPVHLAAAHNRIKCLRGLITKARCEWDCEDRRGRTTAHLAAVHGSIDCLHWLLEYYGDPNVVDREGNTVTHLAAAFGKGDCFNCCLQHGGNLELKNARDETPFDCAKRKGHPVSIQKALTNTVKCQFCVEKHQQFMWEVNHPQPEASRNIQKVSKVAYKPVMPKQQFIEHENITRQPTSEVELNKIKAEKKKLDFLPKKDIVAQFYGKF